MIETIQGIISIMLGLYFILYREKHADRMIQFAEKVFRIRSVSKQLSQLLYLIYGILFVSVGLLLCLHSLL